MAISIGQLFVRNWPIKLAAIFFAIMLYVAVAAQQPLTQSLAMHVAFAVPPGRSIRQQPANVTVVIIGKGTEVMKLRSISHVIHRVVPDTFSASVWHVHLQPADVEIPKGTDVQVADITPRDFDVVLDSVGTKDVKITPRVKVEADSGYVLRGFTIRSEEHTSELQSPCNLVCRLLLEKKKKTIKTLIKCVDRKKR